jgi:hypothetical protein
MYNEDQEPPESQALAERLLNEIAKLPFHHGLGETTALLVTSVSSPVNRDHCACVAARLK